MGHSNTMQLMKNHTCLELFLNVFVVFWGFSLHVETCKDLFQHKKNLLFKKRFRDDPDVTYYELFHNTF